MLTFPSGPLGLGQAADTMVWGGGTYEMAGMKSTSTHILKLRRNSRMGTRDDVNSTLLEMKPRRHRLLTPPPHMAQQHSPPYSSPSPMWLIVVSSAVVTRHRGQPQPSSSSSASSISSPPPSPLYCRAFLLLLPPFSVRVTVATTVSVFLLPPLYSV